MSNEPKFNEDMFDADVFEELGPTSVPGRSAARPEASVSVTEAGVMLAAMERMQAVLQRERDTFDRVGVDLGAMARTIAQGRQTPGTDAAALLDELDGQVRGIMTALGLPVEVSAIGVTEASEAAATTAEAEPSSEEQAFRDALTGESLHADDSERPAAEHDQVPTVSGVVSKLGRSGDPFEAETHGGRHTEPGAHGPSVALLTTMVEALTAVSPDANMASALPSETESYSTIIPEIELLSNFARMESIPFLPAEVGTAVIFAPKPAQPGAAPAQALQPAAPEPEPAPEVVQDETTVVIAPPQAAAPHDSLTLIKAMSDEEKIALFG